MMSLVSPTDEAVKTARIIVLCLLLGILLFVGWKCKRDWDEGQEAIGQNSTLVGREQATNTVTDSANKQAEEAADQVASILGSRQVSRRAYEQVRQSTPSVDAFVRQPIPQQLRDIAKERRLARERLEGDGAGSEGNGVGASGKR